MTFLLWTTSKSTTKGIGLVLDTFTQILVIAQRLVWLKIDLVERVSSNIGWVSTWGNTYWVWIYGSTLFTAISLTDTKVYNKIFLGLAGIRISYNNYWLTLIV